MPAVTAVNLTYPDASVVTVPIIEDDVGSVLDVPAPLPPGSYTLEYFEQTIAFQVTAEPDAQPPAAPRVSASRRTEGSGVSVPFAECPSAGLRDLVVLEVEGAGAGDRLLLLNGVFVTVMNPDGTAQYIRSEDEGGAVRYDVQFRDFAGNMGDATTVEVPMGCQGGCTTVGSMMPLSVCLVAFAVRHRRGAEVGHLAAMGSGGVGQRTTHRR